MEGKILARIGAAVFVGLAITATLIEVSRKEEEPAFGLSEPLAIAEPLDAALDYCRNLGEVATRDPVCLRIWEKNRRRFLRQDAPVAAPLPAPRSPSTTQPSATPPVVPTVEEMPDISPTGDARPFTQPKPARPGTH